MGKSNQLPDRWTHYTPVGKRMAGTRFIAFKVPLKTIFDSKLSVEQRFSPPDLIRKIKEQKEELGLIIDLTCTTRYYDPEELPETLQYSKIFTAGHEIPDPKIIHQFKSIVTTFLSENADNDKLIGVHCTHGLNRSGYLVCRYLIDVEGMAPNAAIELFNRSRGHFMERQNYILDLQGKQASKDHTQNNSGGAMHRGQECFMNGNSSNRTNQDWRRPHHHEPWFAPAWQQHGLQRPPPPSGMYYNGPCDRGYPPYLPPCRPWNVYSWRRPPAWDQSAPAPRHLRFFAEYDPTEASEQPPHPSPPQDRPSPAKPQQEAQKRERRHSDGRKPSHK